MTTLTAFQILDARPGRPSVLPALARSFRAWAARAALARARRSLPRTLDGLPASLRRDLGLLG